MLEKIKEVPFIDESSAVKVVSQDGVVELERSDKVIWAREQTALKADNVDCYVEAKKFLTLLPEIGSLRQTSCLEVELKNGAKYELPFLDVSWETQVMPEEYEDKIKFKLDNLILCTLKNLIKPELQCIWIDNEGAVSCDFISACVTKDVKAAKGFLLPPEIQELVNGRVCKVQVTDSNIFVKAEEFDIVTSRPEVSDDDWYNDIRAMISCVEKFSPTSTLGEGLNRLAMFGDYVSFNGEIAISETNFEPFKFVDLAEFKYEIARLVKVIAVASEMAALDGNILLRDKETLFLVSAMEEA